LLTGVGSTNYEAADSETGARVFGGLFGSKPTRFSNCFEGTYGGTPSVALWGKLAAYTDDCASRTRPLIVRRLDHPHEAPLFKREVGDSEIDLAGNYVAIGNYFDRKAGIEVVDWRDGKTLYTVAADLWADQERAGTFELQPDGKLAAVVVGRGHYCEAAWFSPPSPQAHVMGRTACGADIRLSSDQLAWMRIGKRRGELVVTPLDGIGQTVARFAAIPPAPKAELYSGTTVSQSFAWDGEQLAYSVDRCDGRSTLLLRHHVAGPVFNDRAPLGCPWHLASRVLHLKRGSKSVGVPLRCPRGCEGTMQVTGGHPSIDEPFRLRPGRRYARLFLTDNTRLSLARHGTAEIRLEIDSGGRLGGSRREVRLRLYTR
jgi:hypothetical protein